MGIQAFDQKIERSRMLWQMSLALDLDQLAVTMTEDLTSMAIRDGWRSWVIRIMSFAKERESHR